MIFKYRHICKNNDLIRFFDFNYKKSLKAIRAAIKKRKTSMSFNSVIRLLETTTLYRIILHSFISAAMNRLGCDACEKKTIIMLQSKTNVDSVRSSLRNTLYTYHQI